MGNFQAAVDLALVLQRLGENTQAERLLAKAWEIAARYPRHGLPYRLGDVKILALQGRGNEALAVLEQSIASGWRPYWWLFLKHDPALAALRSDDRFRQLVSALEGAGQRDTARQADASAAAAVR